VSYELGIGEGENFSELVPIKNTRCCHRVLGDGPCRIRTCDQPVMHPTTVFTAPFEFVGWTISSPSVERGLPYSLYTFPTVIGLGSGLPYPQRT